MYHFTEEKIQLLIEANNKLGLCEDQSIEKNKNIVFVYCPPKVGSTSLVTSFRLYALNKYTVFHIHDEIMLKVLCGIENVTINEIIQYNNSLGKNVYVIDIYRSPVEHYISIFFEKLANFHFNNTAENINNYDINKIINRFNKLFPHLSRTDYYQEVYNIPFPDNFDYSNKYLCQYINVGIKYIKLRLKDSHEWSRILNSIFGINIQIVNDYETNKKAIKDIFKLFKENYKIPSNFLQMIKDCPKLKYYYSPVECEQYLNVWRNKQTDYFEPFSRSEYILYTKISCENQYIEEVQRSHYIDDGCNCVGCDRKRNLILRKINNGEKVEEIIDHNIANMEYKKMVLLNKKKRLDQLVERVNSINKINNKIKNSKPKNIVKKSFFNQIK